MSMTYTDYLDMAPPDQTSCDRDCRRFNHCEGRVWCTSCGSACCACETDSRCYCDVCQEANPIEEEE